MKGKIFIIEDEASIVQLVQHNLEKEGFVVSSSLNGNEGLKELKKFVAVNDGESDLLKAMKQIAETNNGPREQIPSAGCGIKWKYD